jgi:hypothetical protein
MSEVFITILKNEDGFTAIEYGLIAAMVLVLASRLSANFDGRGGQGERWGYAYDNDRSPAE